MKRLGLRLVVSLAIVTSLASGCARGTSATIDPEDVASARVAITQAPSDVICVQVTVVGTRTVVRGFDVTPGSTTVFVLQGLPTGHDVFRGAAYPLPCNRVGVSSAATWVSDDVAADLTRGALADVTLKMHANGGATVSVDFPGDDGGTGGTPPPDISPRPDPFVLGEPSFPSVRRGADAIARLGPERAKLLEQLGTVSSIPVKVVVDDYTGVVLTLDAEVASLPGQSSVEKAQAFLSTYVSLLDPRLNVSELFASADPRCQNTTVYIDRSIAEIPVFMSRMTVQFSADGALVQVVNGVAPAPGRILSAMPGGVSGRPLSNVMPKDATSTSVVRQDVLVPAPDGSGLVKAQLATWPSVSQGYQGTLVIGDVALGNTGTLVVRGNGLAGMVAGVPAFHPFGAVGTPQVGPGVNVPPGSRAGITDFISYRSVQGVASNMLPGERNPVEVAYRFLEDHPALFRSGLARCQFAAGDIDESASLPGAVTVHMQQRYVGLPVWGAEVAFNLEGTNLVMAAGGHLLPVIRVDNTPGIASNDAVTAARYAVMRTTREAPSLKGWGASVLQATPSAHLVVFPGALSSGGATRPTALAWEVKLADVTFIVDANKGNVLFSNTTRQASNVIRDGQNQSEFFVPFYPTVDVDGVGTGALPFNSDVLLTRAALSTTAAGYAALGWLGDNGHGGNYTANTNVAISSGCLNAFFSDFVGEAFFCLGVATDDVVGHEFTHGVIAASSRLAYQDESGALNESLADLFGNLFFPDATPGSWLVGEKSAMGAIRDMVNPASKGQPATMAAYVPRGAGCTDWPTSCDSGGVHTNSGITNKAWTLLSDGVTGVTTGMGRAKLTRLAFLTMTQRLTPWTRLNDVPLAMRDACDQLVARGGTGIDGTLFTMSDCDQIPIAFNQVGLNPALSSGWSEPQLGFSGRDTLLAGQTTPTGCNVTDITAVLHTIVGDRQIDLDPATATPASADFLGLNGINFVVPPGTPPMPIGTTSEVHQIDWWDAYGVSPTYATNVIVADPPLGAPDCITPVGFMPIERDSGDSNHPLTVSTLFGASGTDFIGNNPSGMNSFCSLTNTLVEMLNDNGTAVIEGPGLMLDHVTTVWIAFWPVDFHRRASLLFAPPGLPNLSGGVSWSFDTGQQVRFRLHYYISKPTTVADCVP